MAQTRTESQDRDALGGPSNQGTQNDAGSGHRGPEIKVALIGAVAAIVTALISAFVAISTGTIEVSGPSEVSAKKDLQASVASLEKKNDSVDESNQRLTEDNKTLVEENARLQEEVDAQEDESDTPGSTVTTSRTTPGSSTVMRETAGTPLTFTWNYSADLDSDRVDWGVVSGTGSGWDLYLDSDGSVGTREVAIVDHVPTEAECRDATVRQSLLRDDQSKVGAMFCTTTSEKHHAFVRIASIDEERRTTSVDIVVWE